MAIYVYHTANGELYSYIPDDLTIAQAQTGGQLAPTDMLTANGLSAVDSLPPLGPTVVWDQATKTTKTVTAPTPANVCASYDFIMAFTPAELAGIRASTNNAIQQFLFAMQVTQGVNLNATSIKNSLNYLVQQGLLTSGRAATILSTVTSGSAA